MSQGLLQRARHQHAVTTKALATRQNPLVRIRSSCLYDELLWNSSLRQALMTMDICGIQQSRSKQMSTLNIIGR